MSLIPIQRHNTVPVSVGGVLVGGGAPVVVQSMTNTDTADVSSTVAQVAELARAGSELVRITVNNESAARAVPTIRPLPRVYLSGHALEAQTVAGKPIPVRFPRANHKNSD